MKTSTMPGKSNTKSTTKAKPRIKISTKTANPKKRKRITKSSVSSCRSVKAKTTTNGETFNIEDTLDYLAKFAKSAPKTDADLAKVAVGCSENHHNLRDAVLQDVVNCLKTYGTKWEPLLVPTVVKLPNGDSATVPLFVKILSGPKNQAKLELMNKLLIDWQAVTKKKGANQVCPWYQPTTQAQRLRTFFGSMAKRFLWQITLDDLSGEKMVCAFMEKLFAKRLSKYKDVGYGKPNKNRRIMHGDRKKVLLSMFDESDPRQHQMKILFGCGAKFGFRGSQEHVFLELCHVRKGEYEPGHPLEGHTYYGFGGFQDKTNKLNLNNVYLPNDDDMMRCPLVKGDPENLAWSIEKYLEKCSPGQTRFYCKKLSKNAKERYVRNGGDAKHEFMANVPLGKTKIKELFDEGAKLLGLQSADDFYPHSLRAMFITELANDPSVSTRKAQVSARHNNSSSTANYMTRDAVSETNKLLALGMIPQSLNANAKESSEENNMVSRGEYFVYFFY